MTCLLNRLSFFTAVCSIVLFFVSYLLNVNVIYTYANLFVTVLYWSVFLLNVFNKIFWSRLYIAFIIPFWFNGTTIAIGGNLSQSLAAGTVIMIVYLSFRNQPKLRLAAIIYNILFYLSAVVYSVFCTPYFGYYDFPMDEGFVFLVALIWGFAVFKMYENEKEALIQNLQNKNRELQATKDELERFTYIASHDLKSPLRTIISFSDLMELHLKKERYDALKHDLKFVKSGAKQMNYLINDILEFSQITGKKKNDKKDLNLNKVFKKVEHNLHQEIHEKGAKVSSQNLPNYYANETEFILLFQNIIQNGIKYNTSKSPTIQICADQNDSSLSINIRDNGIGIEAEYQEQIFQFFKRLHTSDKYQGTGLGLGLCQKIVRNYGGEISVASALGEGSTFIIELPMMKEQME